MQTQKCEECGHEGIYHVYETGEDVCGECGLVQPDAEWMGSNPELRSWSHEQKRRWVRETHIGEPMSYRQSYKGLTTRIGLFGEFVDARGKMIPKAMRSEIEKLRTLQYRRNGYVKSLLRVSSEIARIGCRLNLYKIILDTAALYYRRILNKRRAGELDRDLNPRGYSGAALAVGAIHAACRSFGLTTTLKEIRDEASVKKIHANRCYSIFVRGLNLRMKYVDPRRYVGIIAHKNNLPEEIVGMACKLLKHTRERRLSQGKSPTGLAAWSVDLAHTMYSRSNGGEEYTTQEKIAEAMGITSDAIAQIRKDLLKGRGNRLRIEYQELAGVVGIDESVTKEVYLNLGIL